LTQGQNQELISIIYQKFKDTAPKREIVYTTLGKWNKPADVYVGTTSSALNDLARHYLPLLPSEITSDFKNFLKNTLKTPVLTIEKVLNYLTPNLRPNVLLTQTHKMINSREKLKLLYQAIQNEWPPEIPKSSSSTEFERRLRPLPIFLAENNYLYSLSASGHSYTMSQEIWCGSSEARNLELTGILHFIDQNLEKDYGFLQKVLWELASEDLLEYLKKLPTLKEGILIAKAPAIINSQEKLNKVLKFLASSSNFTTNLKDLALILNTKDILCTARTAIYLPLEDLSFQDFLLELGLDFVDSNIIQNKEVVTQLEKAGINKVRPNNVTTHLEHLSLSSKLMTSSKPPFNDIAKLIQLYEYFYTNKKDIDNSLKSRLRKLPIFLNQKGWLVPLQSSPQTPALKRLNDGDYSAADMPLNLLGLETLIHADSHQSVAGKGFLLEIMGVEAITPLVGVRDYVLKYYPDSVEDPPTALQLLTYIHSVWVSLSSEEKQELKPALEKTLLIRCQDDKYRSGQEIYLESPEIDSVFGRTNYFRPHNSYLMLDWEDFFIKILGVRQEPSPSDIVKAIKRLTVASPNDDSVRSIQNIFDLLKRKINENHKYYLNSSELQSLSQINWLPSHNFSQKWFKPLEIYPFGYLELLGNAAPVLYFHEPLGSFQEFLRIPSNPPAIKVAQHLFFLSNQVEQQKVSERVYTYLGNNWKDLDYDTQERLRKGKVVWVENSYWIGKKVYIGTDCRRWFGQRRAYLRSSSNIVGGLQVFFNAVGVNLAETPRDEELLNLLYEIANEQFSSLQITPEDLSLVLFNLDYIGRFETKSQQHFIKQLSNLAIVPGQDNKLYRQDRIVIADVGQKELLQNIDPSGNKIPVVMEKLSDDVVLTEQAYQFLRKLGVKLLREVIQRNLISRQDTTFHEKLTERLNKLKRAFERIRLTIADNQGEKALREAFSLDILDSIQVYNCSRLEVSYSLNNGQGWQIKISSSFEEPALYLKDSNIVYVKNLSQDKFKFVPLAKELNQLFFPANNEIKLITDLLEMEPDEANEFLTTFGYRLSYNDITASASLSESGVIGEELENIESMESPFIESNVENSSVLSLQRVEELPNQPNLPINENLLNLGQIAPEKGLLAPKSVFSTAETPESNENSTPTAPAKQTFREGQSGADNRIPASDYVGHQNVDSVYKSNNQPHQDNKETQIKIHTDSPEQIFDKERYIETDLSNAEQERVSDMLPIIFVEQVHFDYRQFNNSATDNKSDFRKGESSQATENQNTKEPHTFSTGCDKGGLEWEPEIEPEDTVINARKFEPRQHRKTSNNYQSSFSNNTTSSNTAEQVKEETAENDDPSFSYQTKYRIGMWGERYVLYCLLYLFQIKYPYGEIELDRGSFTIVQEGKPIVIGIWLNCEIDSGVGHDILIIDGNVEHYIEVKSTIDDKRKWFDLTRREWELAQEKRENFHLFRVFNAGTKQAKMLCITNPYQNWLDGNLIAYPVRVNI